jgi:hypothetical protein
VTVTLALSNAARAVYDADFLDPDPAFNSCYFDGWVYYTDDLVPPYAEAATDPHNSANCNAMKMYVSLHFHGSDYKWHWYPVGPVWVTAYGGLITSDVDYWTDHAHGWHQMQDVYGCGCYSSAYMTDTD